MSDPDDRELLNALATMWQKHDPVPAGLDDEVLAAVDAALIVSDAALLELIEDTDRMAGVRAAADGRTLTFSDGAREVLIRLVRGPTGVRIDGWTVPSQDGRVCLRVAEGRTREFATGTGGRFEFAGLPEGEATLWFEPAAGAGPRGWKTSPFAL